MACFATLETLPVVPFAELLLWFAFACGAFILPSFESTARLDRLALSSFVVFMPKYRTRVIVPESARDLEALRSSMFQFRMHWARGVRSTSVVC